MNVNDQQSLALAVLENYLQTKSHASLIKFWQLYPKPIPSWHLTMMNDKPRNDFYQKEIHARAADKVVLDLGCGSGLLTQFALEAGAKHIYAVEMDPVLQRCFAFAFKDEIAAGKITLISKNSKDLTVEDFPTQPELIVHEMFGKALFNERVVETFSDLFKRNILNPSLEFFPHKFVLHACLHQQTFESKIKDPKYSEKFWFLEDISYFGIPTQNITDKEQAGEDVSSDFEIFSSDLANLSDRLETEQKIVASKDGNLLRVWFELHGKTTVYSTDTRTNKENHWGNSKYFLRFSKGEVNLKSTYSNGKFLTYVKKAT